jgi:hypothetical protein
VNLPVNRCRKVQGQTGRDVVPKICPGRPRNACVYKKLAGRRRLENWLGAVTGQGLGIQDNEA